MKILYLCADLGIPVLGRKGASVHVRAMVNAFGEAGHSVILASSLLNKSPWEEPSAIDVRLLHLPPANEVVEASLTVKAFNETLGVQDSLPGELRRILHNQNLITQLKHRFESDPPDFIYERASLYATAGVSLGRELNIPVLVELNAPLAVEQSIYRSTGLGELVAQAERWMLSRADAVFAVSGPLRDYVVSLGVEPQRIHVLPNGVDQTLFKPGPADPTIRARWGLTGGPVLGFVGGLRRWHGVEVLAPLLDRICEHHRDAQMLIVGDGPLRGALEQDLREHDLTRRVLFTGALPHEEIAGLIRQFDVALAPYSKPEHVFYFSPLKIFEYMACGVPVVAAALGQNAELVRNCETGLLYTPGDIHSLTSACEKLLADVDLRQRLGHAAAQEIHGRYTWGHNAASVVELARTLVAERRERA
jgi:glycosyltransferase involved in cell wall biosynthesis